MSKPPDRPRCWLLRLVVPMIAALVAACAATPTGEPVALKPTRQASALRSPAPLTVPPPTPTTGRISPRAAELATVRQYFRVLNHLDVAMDADALAALMTPSCPCRKQVRSVRTEREEGHFYVDGAVINAIRVHVDGPAIGDVLVDYNATAGGIRDATGHWLSRAPLVRHVNWDFTLAKTSGRWQIARIEHL